MSSIRNGTRSSAAFPEVITCSRASGPRSRPVCATLDAMERAARRERLLYVKVQVPAGHEALVPALATRGYVASRLEAAPTATVRVGLGPTLEAIEQRMRTNARRNARRARRIGVEVRVGAESELSAFHALMRGTGRRKGFAPYPDHYYRAMWRAFAA